MSNYNTWNEMTLDINTIYLWIKDPVDKKKLIGKIQTRTWIILLNNIALLNRQRISKDA